MKKMTPVRIGLPLISLFLCCLSTSLCAQTWYNTSWSYRKSITIDRTKVGSGTHANFPVLISITDNDLLTKARSNGYDILFTSSDGATKLNHEIESYNSSTGALVAWVNVPSLPSATNTVLYMYYGNSSASNQQNRTGTWDASFRGVYHLNGVFSDATSNARNGTNSGTTAITGKISNGRSFNGSSKITITGLMGSPASVTLSGWANLTTRDATGSHLVNIGDYASINADDVIDGYLGAFYNAGWGLTKSSPKINNAGTGWHYFVYTFTAGTQSLYLDGVLKGSGSYAGSISYSGLGTNTIIGAHGAGSTNFDWIGSIDEVRIAGSARSASWILTEYNNQNAPATFYSVSGEAIVPLPVTFVSVQATERNNGIEVSWDVAFEDGVEKYEVERSINGTSFVNLASVSADGNVQYRKYSWLDESTTAAKVYYRIRSVDFDGKTDLSKTVMVRRNEGGAKFVASPNPLKGSVINLYMGNLGKGRYGFVLSDVQGKPLFETSIDHAGGILSRTLNIGRLNKGVYYLRMQAATGSSLQTILAE